MKPNKQNKNAKTASSSELQALSENIMLNKQTTLPAEQLLPTATANSFFSFLKTIKHVSVASPSNIQYTMKATQFKHRMTGHAVMLATYGRKGTFTLALANKIAKEGCSEEEYVALAQQFKANEKRFKEYARFYKQQGFDVAIVNGRIVELSN